LPKRGKRDGFCKRGEIKRGALLKRGNKGERFCQRGEIRERK